MIDKVMTLIKKFSKPYKEQVLIERGWHKYSIQGTTFWSHPQGGTDCSSTDQALEREFKCLSEKVESLTKEK